MKIRIIVAHAAATFLFLLLLISVAGAQSDPKTVIEANIGFTRTEINRALNADENRTADDIQKLLFEPEVWKKEFAATLKVAPGSITDESLAPIREEIDKLKKLIAEGTPKRFWKQPPYNRAAEQAMAKTKFIAYYKGATVLKIGSNFADWKMYKNSLGIPTNRFIRGIALLKIPNRPDCQVQEWIVKQSYAGGRWSTAVVDSFGGGGVFTPCQ